MELRGEDVAASVRDWIKDDIKKGPSSRHELGKFFVGISTGTLGLFATLLKFAVKEPALDWLTGICFVLLLLSVVVGMYMAVPNVTKVREDMELYSEYNAIVGLILKLMSAWLVLWALGFVFGVAKLFQ